MNFSDLLVGAYLKAITSDEEFYGFKISATQLVGESSSFARVISTARVISVDADAKCELACYLLPTESEDLDSRGRYAFDDLPVGSVFKYNSDGANLRVKLDNKRSLNLKTQGIVITPKAKLVITFGLQAIMPNLSVKPTTDDDKPIRPGELVKLFNGVAKVEPAAQAVEEKNEYLLDRVPVGTLVKIDGEFYFANGDSAKGVGIYAGFVDFESGQMCEPYAYNIERGNSTVAFSDIPVGAAFKNLGNVYIKVSKKASRIIGTYYTAFSPRTGLLPVELDRLAACSEVTITPLAPMVLNNTIENCTPVDPDGDGDENFKAASDDAEHNKPSLLVKKQARTIPIVGVIGPVKFKGAFVLPFGFFGINIARRALIRFSNSDVCVPYTAEVLISSTPTTFKELGIYSIFYYNQRVCVKISTHGFRHIASMPKRFEDLVTFSHPVGSGPKQNPLRSRVGFCHGLHETLRPNTQVHTAKLIPGIPDEERITEVLDEGSEKEAVANDVQAVIELSAVGKGSLIKVDEKFYIKHDGLHGIALYSGNYATFTNNKLCVPYTARVTPGKRIQFSEHQTRQLFAIGTALYLHSTADSALRIGRIFSRDGEFSVVFNRNAVQESVGLQLVLPVELVPVAPDKEYIQELEEEQDSDTTSDFVKKAMPKLEKISEMPVGSFFALPDSNRIYVKVSEKKFREALDGSHMQLVSRDEDRAWVTRAVTVKVGSRVSRGIKVKHAPMFSALRMAVKGRTLHQRVLRISKNRVLHIASGTVYRVKLNALGDFYGAAEFEFE